MNWTTLPAEVARRVTVTPTDFPGQGWRVSAGSVHHDRTDFFQLVGRMHADGRQSILIRQNEPALVGLGVCDTPEGRWYLLNARAEPGLHGVCQYSSTIQSTPSNYLRRHGGAPTPLIDDFTHPETERVEHESWQFDLGDRYDRKIKLFRVVHFSSLIEVDTPLLWVHEADVATLLRADYSTTSDLTIALTLPPNAPDALANPGEPPLIAQRDGTRDVDFAELSNWVIEREGIREKNPDQHVEFVAVTTSASTREVTQWEQPLMAPTHDASAHLPSAIIDGQRRFAVQQIHQRGLGGNLLWSCPSDAPLGSRTLARRHVSAEGGRFWRHTIRLTVTDDPGAPDRHAEWSWWSLGELDAAHAQGLSTTVELRLLTALIRAHEVHRR